MGQISTKQAAKILNVTPRRVRALVKTGDLVATMFFGRMVFDESAVRAFAKIPRTPGPKPKSSAPRRKR